MKLRVLTALALSVLSLAAASPARSEGQLFDSDSPIHIAIQAPLASLARDRTSDVPVAGTLTDPGGLALPVSLRLRGITRRNAGICDFPPLRVDFTAPPPAGSLFAGQKHLKLVTHCRSNAAFQQYVLLEYAAYRMFNLLSPKSFRVRLANVDYSGTDGRSLVSRVGFFIEDLGDVARRNGLREAHAPIRISLADLRAEDAARYGLFQDMLANHDWSMRAGPAGEECCHNAQMIGAAAPGMAIPIPYDFDFSGFVNAPYAAPPDVLRINSVRERVYRGYCAHNAEALAAARQLREARPQLLATIAAVPGLDPRTRDRATTFLAPFFADIATDQSVAVKIFARCVN